MPALSSRNIVPVATATFWQRVPLAVFAITTLPLAVVHCNSISQTVRLSDEKRTLLTCQWFMHWELTTYPIRTETWHFFVNEFMPGHLSLTKEVSLEEENGF